MAGSIILSGGAEFTAEGETVVRVALTAARRQVAATTGTSRRPPPRVVIIPVTASDNVRRTVRAGVHYFKKLGAQAAIAMIIDMQSADDAVQASAIEYAPLIYLPDGNPFDAVNALRDSEALVMLRRALASGSVVLACGAGAMALADHFWDGGVWEVGLGLLNGIAVMPHHQAIIGRFSGERLRQGLPAETVLVGLDDEAGLVCDNPERAYVIGGQVTIYRTAARETYASGQTVKFDRSLTNVG